MALLLNPPGDDPPEDPDPWQLRPFTAEYAREMGLSAGTLYGPRFRRVMHGVFISAQAPDTIVVRARAARLLLPKDAVFSHQTAARLLSGPVPDTAVVHASVARSCRRRIQDVALHRYTYEMDAIWRHGMPVTSPAQTFIHLAAQLELPAVVAFGDAMLSHDLVSKDNLEEAVGGWQRRGGAAARYAMRFVRAGVDSPPESHVRLLFALAGLPEPQLNFVQSDDHGVILRRIELAYRETPARGPNGARHLGFEYDGRAFHSTPEQKSRDALRRAELSVDGWHIEVIDADYLYRRPEMLLGRAHELMGQFGLDVPRHLNHAWRRHFWVPTWSRGTGGET
ncbi:MAG: hypothetical protein Q4G67_08090 [Actinomycetia bacterium]|nr:hypothetical protein [Actinomycetes bacterium]